jgi:hypothetical protein
MAITPSFRGGTEMDILILIGLIGVDYHFNQWKICRFLIVCGQTAYKQIGEESQDKDKDEEKDK